MLKNIAIGAFLAVALGFFVFMAGQAARAEAPLDQPQTTNTPLFIMAGIFYTNGQFVKLVTFGEPMEDKHDCMEKLQHAVGAVIQNGKIPAGGSLIGACIPVPQLVRPTES